MSNKTYTAAPAGDGTRINVYDAMTGGIHQVITLSRGTRVIAGPIMFNDGFSVTLEEPDGTYMATYDLPRCNIRSKSHIS